MSFEFVLCLTLLFIMNNYIYVNHFISKLTFSHTLINLSQQNHREKNVKLLFQTFSLLNLKPMEDMKIKSAKCL